MATVAPMQQSMAQVQIPVGIQPGQQFQANMNGMMIYTRSRSTARDAAS